MAPPRSYFIALSVMAVIVAVSGDDTQTAKKLEEESAQIAAQSRDQLLAAFAKLRSDYDASEAAEIKAQTSADVRAALQKGSEALAKVRVPQRAALQAFALRVGNETASLTGNYTALIDLYIKDKAAAANKQTNRPAILKLRQAKQAALVQWEEGLVSLFFDMRAALRAAHKGVASAAAVQKAVDASVVKLVDTLIEYQGDVQVLLTATLSSKVESFAARANTELLHLTNQAEAPAQ